MMTRRTRWLLLIAAGLPAPGRACAQLVQTDSAAARARRHFDFLVGDWQVVGRSDLAPGAAVPDESYQFEKALDGVMIAGRWRFNRGTPERPDVVNAVYYSGYDNSARQWNFYYVSPQSAQYWPGTLTNGRWVFSRTFTYRDTTFLQHQWWERIDDDTIVRHIDNSPDNGATWRPFTIRLRRRPRVG